ncbi:hypothetical protein HDU91_002106 [Kappamyces sp. JEL0680]|nr:hypothetical protein HDU91_002106 [Kappamyces sp. JEL0680]
MSIASVCIVLLCSIGSVLSQTPNATRNGLAYQPPLHTMGNQILDSNMKPIHLHCTAWAGAHTQGYLTYGMELQPLAKNVDFIEQAGFNCVRLEFSAELVLKNAVVDPALLTTTNPQLAGLRAMDIYAAIVQEITSRGIMVILDFHTLDATWCCDQNDQNGAWFNDRWTEEQATQQLVAMVQRHADNPFVVGVDLRNEIRPNIGHFTVLGQNIPKIDFYPNWGLGGKSDWAAAAERLGNAVLAVNSKLLCFVQGIFVFQPEDLTYLLKGGSLQGIKIPQSLKSVKWRPINLNVANRVVYSTHDYDWHYLFDWSKPVSYEDYRNAAEKNYGYVMDTYPLWLGEIGTSNDVNGVENNQHWQYLVRYITEKKFHWALWEFSGNERGHAVPNTFSIMNVDHSAYAYPPYLQSLRSIMF